jgi:hypothetical protein
LGLLAAGIAALVIQSPELSAAFMTTFSEVKSVASETMTGIYDAISGGDLGGAMDIAMEGLKAAWLRGTADLQIQFTSWSSQFQNGFTDLGTGIAVAWEHMFSQMKQTAMSLQPWKYSSEDIATVQAETDRNVLAMESQGKETIGSRTAASTAFAESTRTAATASQSRLSSLTSKASLRRTLTSQADDLIASIGDATSMDDLKSAADEFFALKSSGMLTAAQEKKYGESIDLAAEKLTPTGTSGIVQSAVAVKPPDKEQMQMAAMDAAGKQAEVAGTFSSVNLGGMGFGASLQQQQLDVLKQIKGNTDDFGDEGAVAA